MTTQRMVAFECASVAEKTAPGLSVSPGTRILNRYHPYDLRILIGTQ